MEGALELGFRGGRCVAESRIESPRLLVHNQPPHSLQEAIDPFDVLHLPGLLNLERAHEELVQPHRVGAVRRDHVVRVDDIELRLGHLLDLGLEFGTRALEEEPPVTLLNVRGVVILAARVTVGVGEDHALVEELGERLGGVDQPAVVEHLVPETGVQ